MSPDKYTNQELFLDVGDGHQLYIQDWGNKKAKTPIIYIHGGPGLGCSDRNKRNFDPRLKRVIFFDQRGAGQSLPLGSLKDNTTPKLVEDIEKIAEKLDLKQFVLNGGSWGSCLALAYAIKYPKRVAGMVIQGVLCGSSEEIEWIERGRFVTFFPDAWADYLAATPSKYHSDPSKYQFQQILGDDPLKAKASAYVYSNLESALIRLDNSRLVAPDFETFDPLGTITEVHFLANKCFLPDNYIVNNAHQLTMPIWMIQGRYDMVCPPLAAYKLHHVIPKNSRMLWTINGHLAEHEAANIMNLGLEHLTEGL